MRPRPQRTRRIPATLLAVLLALVTGATPALAQGDSAAVAVNTRDHSDVFRIAFHIQRVAGDTVDQANAAVAYASCDACQTVAIAIQALLLLDQPTVVTPENLALALNVDCNDCQTLASAYQFVVGAGSPVHFTAAGNRQVADIRRQLQQLRNAGLSIVEIQARVNALADQLHDVLANDIVTAGDPPGPEAPATPTTDATAGPTPTPTPDATATPTPTPTPTPDATATPTPDTTATPTPTPDATVTATPDTTATPSPTPTPDTTVTPTPDAPPAGS